jgi:electron transfer flavoprotein alpha/beta subunit
MRIAVLLRATHAQPESEETLAGLGPCDRAALNTALAMPGCEVVALTLGPPPDDCVLQAALRAGVHRAIRIWENNLQSHEPHLLCSLLAAAAQEVGFNLVLAGHRSTDWGTGIVGPTVAHILQIPHLNSVVSIKLKMDTILLEQLREDELLSVEMNLPSVISVLAGPSRSERLDEPAHATLPAIEHWGIEHLLLVMDEVTVRAEVKSSGKPGSVYPWRKNPERLDDAATLMRELRRLIS